MVDREWRISKRKPEVKSLTEIFQRQLDFQRNVQPDVRVRKIKLFKVRVQSSLHKFRMFWYMRIKRSTDPKCTYTEFLLLHWTVVIFLILTWLNIQRWVGMDPNTFWLGICGKYGSYFRLPYSIVLVWAPDGSESSPQTDQSTSASGICLCGIYHLFKTPFLRTQWKSTNCVIHK